MPTATRASTRSRPTSTATSSKAPSNLSIPTAQDLTSSSYLLGPGNADRLAAVGSLPTGVLHVGDVFVSSRYYGFYFSAQTISDILRVNSAGPDRRRSSRLATTRTCRSSGVELDPVNNMLYAAVTTSFNGPADRLRLGRRRAARVRPDHRAAGGDDPAADDR